MTEQGHGGLAAARALEALGVKQVFTLSGGHIFPLFDGCKQVGVDLVDVRHEQTAGYAAEGLARLSRSLGVAAVTAGPGVTNIVSPLAQAGFNGASVLALAGRAPQFRWGSGSLQEIDHVPFVGPLARARTVTTTDAIAQEVLAAARAALTSPRGPAFLDFPLDVLFNATAIELPEVAIPPAEEPDPDQIEAIARLILASERPALICGAGVWLDGAVVALRTFVDKTGMPVFMNGQGRGCLPADHERAFARSRSHAFKRADLVIVAGAPLDFRLGFGEFASGPKVVHLESSASKLASHVQLAAGVGARLDLAFTALAQSLRPGETNDDWIRELRAAERERRDLAATELASESTPVHPMRIYGELVPLLERDAIVIGDGGDFVSYAGREVPSYEPGCWLDPGPFGCLGCGPGYAIAAATAYPGRRVVLLLGDGAIGFSGMELEAIVRHGLPVVCIVGNNGIWGLEKHPMRALYGYDVVADLRPGVRYDQMMTAFGGRGELVVDPGDIRPALERAFASGEPALVNVLTDPQVAYPRSANLA